MVLNPSAFMADGAPSDQHRNREFGFRRPGTPRLSARQMGIANQTIPCVRNSITAQRAAAVDIQEKDIDYGSPSPLSDRKAMFTFAHSCGTTFLLRRLCMELL